MLNIIVNRRFINAMTPNCLVLGVALTASLVAAPAKAGTLGWSDGVSDFFSQVEPGINDTFSVTFNPDNVALITTANGEFVSPFDPAPTPYTAQTTATGNFRFVEFMDNNEFRYELTSPLSFVFPEFNNASITWETGTTFRGFFTDESVQFSTEHHLPTVAGIGEFVTVYSDVLQFGDGEATSSGGTYNAEVEVGAVPIQTVPEPGTLLGLLACGSFGLSLKHKNKVKRKDLSQKCG